MILNKNIMQNDVNQRIKKVLQENNISIAAFSKDVGLPQPTVNRQLSDDNKVSITTVKSFLSRFPRISAEWLLKGIGDECCGIPDEQLDREIAETNRGNIIAGDNNHHNIQTTNVEKENELLKERIQEKEQIINEKNEEIKFLRSLLTKNTL